jgi:hypothetical protein
MVVVGYVLIAFGVVFIALGTVGAAAAVFAKKGFAVGAPTIAEIIKLIPDLIKALTKAPQWLAMTFVGILLLLLGLWIVQGSI